MINEVNDFIYISSFQKKGALKSFADQRAQKKESSLSETLYLKLLYLHLYYIRRKSICQQGKIKNQGEIVVLQ